MSEQEPVTAAPARVIKRFHTVCKRSFKADPAYFPRTVRRGKIISFCTEACLDAYLADPERFYPAHSRPSGTQVK